MSLNRKKNNHKRLSIKNLLFRSIIEYYFHLAPIIAFGGLLGEATEQRIATIEGLVAGLLSGVLFSLFSGQPLNLVGSTGPVYVFEKILYEMCSDQVS